MKNQYVLCIMEVTGREKEKRAEMYLHVKWWKINLKNSGEFYLSEVSRHSVVWSMPR